MPNPVVHWEIGAKDAKKIQDFYARLFDWRVDANNPMNYGMVETGGQVGINGGIMQTHDEIPPYLTFYVQVDDLQGFLNKAESLGGKTIVPVTEVPNVVTFAMFSDPEGHVVGLVKA